MLSNLELVNCYNATSMARDRIMLESAKENLLRMAFFGVTELQKESQLVFQRTFNMRFKVKFPQFSSVETCAANQNNLHKRKVKYDIHATSCMRVYSLTLDWRVE